TGYSPFGYLRNVSYEEETVIAAIRQRACANTASQLVPYPAGAPQASCRNAHSAVGGTAGLSNSVANEKSMKSPAYAATARNSKSAIFTMSPVRPMDMVIFL